MLVGKLCEPGVEEVIVKFESSRPTDVEVSTVIKLIESILLTRAPVVFEDKAIPYQ